MWQADQNVRYKFVIHRKKQQQHEGDEIVGKLFITMTFHYHHVYYRDQFWRNG